MRRCTRRLRTALPALVGISFANLAKLIQPTASHPTLLRRRDSQSAPSSATPSAAKRLAY